MPDEFKQAIVVRRDLRMSPGKTAAQAAHASVGAVLEAQGNGGAEWVRGWLDVGMPKIVLRVDGPEALAALAALALADGVPHCEVTDAGRTELAPNTSTCIGIGPAPRKLVDRITGALPLL